MVTRCRILPVDSDGPGLNAKGYNYSQLNYSSDLTTCFTFHTMVAISVVLQSSVTSGVLN